MKRYSRNTVSRTNLSPAPLRDRHSLARSLLFQTGMPNRRPRRPPMVNQRAVNKAMFFRQTNCPADPPSINSRPWVSATLLISQSLTGANNGVTITDLLDALARQFGVNSASSFNLRLQSVKVWATPASTRTCDLSCVFMDPFAAITDPPMLSLTDTGTNMNPARMSFNFGLIRNQRFVNSTGNTARQFVRITVDTTCYVDLHVGLQWCYSNINPVIPSLLRREQQLRAVSAPSEGDPEMDCGEMDANTQSHSSLSHAFNALSLDDTPSEQQKSKCWSGCSRCPLA